MSEHLIFYFVFSVNMRSLEGSPAFITWLPFLGMHNFNFCIVLTDRRFYFPSKYSRLLFWRIASFGSEVLKMFYCCTFSGESNKITRSFEVYFNIQGCFSIYFTPIRFRESFNKLWDIKSFNYYDAGTTIGKLILPFSMLALSYCSDLPLKGTSP